MFSAGVSAHAMVKLAWNPRLVALAKEGSEQATWEKNIAMFSFSIAMKTGVREHDLTE